MSEQAINAIERINAMETADWEDGPGNPVRSRTKMRAAVLLQEVKRQSGPAWVEAAASATPSGGVHFSWCVGGNRATLTILGGNALVVGVCKLGASPSCRKEMTDAEAVAFMVPAFSPAGLETSYTGANGDGQ